MSAQVPGSVPVEKGAVCYGLDQISIGPGARARVANLLAALQALPTATRAGLTDTLDEYVLEFVFTPAQRTQIVDHLNQFWFDPASPDAYFKNVPVAKIYGDGVIQTCKLSLNRSGPVVPLDCWWLLDFPEVQVIPLAEEDQGQTTSDIVTMLIQTPRPKPIEGLKPKPPWILGKAEAYVVRSEKGGPVRTTRVKTLPAQDTRARRNR